MWSISKFFGLIERQAGRPHTSSLSCHLNALKDLCASGDDADPDGGKPDPREVSRIRPPLMLGVFAQKAQIYTVGSVRLDILMHLPWSHSSHDSLEPR